MIQRLSPYILFILSGCTFYGTPVRIDNWPDLRIVEHRVSQDVVRDECSKYAPWWAVAGGCAIYYRTECHVWASEDWVAEIERNNCSGLVMPYWEDRAKEIRDKIISLNREG